MWNSIGIVRCYNTEDENSIDVEFHDTSLHHALHINNFFKHTMAALTDEALVLACEIQDEAPRYISETLLSRADLMNCLKSRKYTLVVMYLLYPQSLVSRN